MITPVWAAVPVIPGASGFGMQTPAGRGGKVLRVTSLEASGAGTLREAIEARGARTIVFDVAGVIDLNGEELLIDEPLVTIAGQTAPPPGITIIKGSLRVRASDVLIQHLRIRPGDAGKPKKSGWSPDGISLNNVEGKPGVRRVVIDHVSATWAVDENLSVSGPRHAGREGTSGEVTLRHCIIAQSLRDSSHEKGPHSMGTLIHDHVRNVSVIGNLYAGNDNRNPVLKPDAGAVVVNNLIVNPGQKAIHSYWPTREYEGRMETMLPPTLVAVGNVLWAGADTPAGLRMISFAANQGEVFEQDNASMDAKGKSAGVLEGSPKKLKDKPMWPEGLTALPARDVPDYVLSRAGAWPRDAIDEKLIASARDKSLRVIDSQEQVGGYPQVKPVKRAATLPADPSGDADGDGYTNLEEWLHQLSDTAMRSR